MSDLHVCLNWANKVAIDTFKINFSSMYHNVTE